MVRVGEGRHCVFIKSEGDYIEPRLCFFILGRKGCCQIAIARVVDSQQTTTTPAFGVESERFFSTKIPRSLLLLSSHRTPRFESPSWRRSIVRGKTRIKMGRAGTHTQHQLTPHLSLSASFFHEQQKRTRDWIGFLPLPGK